METETSNNKAEAAQAVPAIKSRRSWWIVGGVAALVALIVFAGGAFAAGRLSTPGRGSEGEGFFRQRPDFQIVPAKELPAGAPNVSGIATQVAGNTLTVGQRNGGFGPGGSGSTALVDVIVASDTTIYHDTTQTNFNGQPPSGSVQQTLEPGALHSIAVNSRVTVWGDQTGNQVTARVLVYTDPLAFRQPSQ